MDSNCTKRRSFSKMKLVKSIYCASKPSAASKPPKPTAVNSSPAPTEFGAYNQARKPKTSPDAAGSAVGYIIVNQDQIFPQPAPKVALVMAEERNRGVLENFYSGGPEDEAVDAKAAKYISSVQERFRLERLNSESKNFQDILV